MRRADPMIYIYCISRLLSPRLPGACAGQGQSMLFLLSAVASAPSSVSGIEEALSMHPRENGLALLSILSACFIAIHVVKVHSRNNKHRTSSLLRSSYPTLRQTHKGKTNFFLKEFIHTTLVLPDCAGGQAGRRAGVGGGGCPPTQLVSMIQSLHLAELTKPSS